MGLLNRPGMMIGMGRQSSPAAEPPLFVENWDGFAALNADGSTLFGPDAMGDFLNWNTSDKPAEWTIVGGNRMRMGVNSDLDTNVIFVLSGAPANLTPVADARMRMDWTATSGAGANPFQMVLRHNTVTDDGYLFGQRYLAGTGALRDQMIAKFTSSTYARLDTSIGLNNALFDNTNLEVVAEAEGTSLRVWFFNTDSGQLLKSILITDSSIAAAGQVALRRVAQTPADGNLDLDNIKVAAISAPVVANWVINDGLMFLQIDDTLFPANNVIGGNVLNLSASQTIYHRSDVSETELQAEMEWYGESNADHDLALGLRTNTSTDDGYYANVLPGGGTTIRPRIYERTGGVNSILGVGGSVSRTFNDKFKYIFDVTTSGGDAVLKLQTFKNDVLIDTINFTDTPATHSSAGSISIGRFENDQQTMYAGPLTGRKL